MSWDLKKRKLQALWSQITSRPSSHSSTARHESPSQSQGWRPFTLRPIYLTFLACLMFLMALILEGMRRYTNWYGGLVFMETTEEVSDLQSFAYNYLPIIVALILLTLWSLVDFDVLRLEPYFQLARPEGVPASVLFINYNFGQTFITPFLSAKRGHWVALLVSIVTVLIRMFLPALQSTLLELREVTVITNETMKTWPDLLDLGIQANWIATQEQNNFDSVNSAFASTDTLQKSRFPGFAVPPVQIPTNDRRESTVWKVNQTIYWPQFFCRDLLVDNALPVTINQTDAKHPRVSWNATGLSLVNGTNQNCSLDFHYDSVFYPGTDFLQVRYWEPALTTDTFDSGEVRKAFLARGCDPFDLYGVLLSVNATIVHADAISSLGPQYTSSTTMFACNIEYHKSLAEVSMHANSSITSIHVIENTTANLTSQEFNIEEFQGLLSHRAPYTSDVLFMQYNSTMGDRIVTELPVIRQDMGDLEAMPVLDTATIMKQGEFQEKVKRGVIQTFVLTMGRLFNPDAPPTTVPAVRFAHQVTIAVVSFAATLSEAILLLSTVVALALLYFYQRRPNILQSDPSSIGAMCSILTDLFSPSNILGNAQSDLHQLSTRQLRALLRNFRLYWQEGLMGRRVEIVPVDGDAHSASAGLGDRIRTRADPRPHFLVIPIFIVEFLLLVAVIAVMALVIASLAHEGSFQHLTQSDSSFFQVVLSFLPSVVASSVGSLCNSIHRNISILEPWVHLQRGQAKAGASLSMNYASQTPWLVLLKTIRDRHFLLGLVSLACVMNTALTVVAGGLFMQKLTTSGFATHVIQANYSSSIFKQTDFAADFTEYDLIQTSITSGVPLLPWTSPDYSFVPLKNTEPNVAASYAATTLGIGADLDCRRLSISEDLKTNLTTGQPYWQYRPFQNNSRQCTVNMFRQKHKRVPLSIHFLSPAALEDMDQCQTFTVLVMGRWNYTGDSAMTEDNTVALHCEPQVQMQNFSILFDQRGQIQEYDPMPHTEITSGAMYDNATVSLGQFNKVFAAIPQSFADDKEQKGPTVASYDWAGFLVARLYKQRENGIASLDPDDLILMSGTVYQWVYSTYFSLWGPTYLQPLETPYTATNATIYYSTWAMVPSVPSLTIALSIIALDTLVVLVVFGTRRGRFKGPRIPRSIGSVIPWIANSRMLSDFRGTYSWTSLQRRDYLQGLNKRYAFRMFLGPDGQWRFAVDEEPLVAENKPTVVADGDLDPTKQADAIELRPIGDRTCTTS
ncbi:hypothetical protein BDV28DRAFT_43166 [Aspergillus coremiiformis]|uniref:Uncharacterized protein n=1 Tax=Aspergillus coremiiformis TaxID=138285 RepID=A0A5N6Z039_9EURO|nr:hypothetical protein BDV28DRAFT_43166 [Aspergillus coremiiformis]